MGPRKGWKQEDTNANSGVFRHSKENSRKQVATTNKHPMWINIVFRTLIVLNRLSEGALNQTVVGNALAESETCSRGPTIIRQEQKNM
jgi:hypothetical protein